MEQGRKNNRSGLVFSGLLIAIISFAAGMRSDAIFGAVAPALGLRVGTGSLDMSIVQDAYRQLKANYDGKLDEQALIYGAARGMTAAAGDRHTVYMDPKEAEEFNKSLQGNIGGGIGAEIGLRHDQPTIIRPLNNSPAANAGVMAGDVIVQVNDDVVSGWTVEETVSKIRGEVGTTVKLKLMRGNSPHDVSITRAEVVAPAAEGRIEDGVGVLKVSHFNDETGPMARREADNFKSQGVRKIVLDLRGNGGGTVSAAQALAGLWLDDQVIMTQRRGGQVMDTVKSTGQPILSGIETVVLINGGSASASEIVAGALKDHGKATLVGEKTYGKGSVQVPLRLSGGALLKVTESRWFTPGGKNIDKKGIEPDTTVELTADDVNNNRDPQLERAMR